MDQSRDHLDAYQRRSGSVWRWVIVGVLAILLLPALAVAVLIARFDPNRYAPAIIAAVDQATGRQLTLSGPVTIKLSLTPVIAASDISLSNPPGFADPNLLTLRGVEAKIALLPLLSHRLDILQLVLVTPSIVLERNDAGAANWDFAPPHAASPAMAGPMPIPGSSGGYKVALEAVKISNGLLTIKEAGAAAPVIVVLPTLIGMADSLAAPLHLTAEATLGAMPFSATGVVGPIMQLSGIGTAPWPVDMAFQLGSATATIRGKFTRPHIARGYDLAVNLNVPALEALSGILPTKAPHGMTLPALHGLTAAARIVDQNSTIPAIDDLSIKAGSSDLSALRPGLALNSLDIEMASLDQPVAIQAAGKLGDSPMTLTAHLGAPQALLNPALLPSTMPPQGSYPVSEVAQAGDAKAMVQGAIATPETLSGAALALSGTIPDLSKLAPLAGRPLPAWTHIAMQTTLIDPGGQGLRNAAGLDGLVVTMDNAAFGGAASLYFGARPRLQLALKFSQVNVDALRSEMPPPAAPAVAQPSPAPAGAPAMLIPDTPLPLKLLKRASADMQISADTLIWNQATFSALQAHGVLGNGVLLLRPVTGQLPGGAVTASATLDATKEPATATVKVNAPALALAPFLRTFGILNTAEGTVQAQFSATGSGDTPRALAASLDGQLGLAMVNGVVDGAVLDELFGTALQTVGLPEGLVAAQGPVPVRCAALRVDAANGIGTIRALTLDSNRLFLQGGGNIDFGQETLGIILRPQMRVAGTDVGVPVEIGGSFLAPATTVPKLSAVQVAASGAAGLSAGLAQPGSGNNSILGRAENLLGIGDPRNAGDACPAALSLGRLGQPGPAAPPMGKAGAPGGTAPALRGPQNLLNTLLSK
jgi:AsmA protein